MRKQLSLWITALLLASCTSQPTAPCAPPALPGGHSTVASVGSAAPKTPAAEHHASGKPEIRYYEIADA